MAETPKSPDRPPEGERIAKLLARAGVASRREVERMIADGRVALDGAPVATPATILPHLRGVTVDGKPVAKAEPTRLYRFHKPAGLITAERDPAGRPTIYTALRNALPPGAPRLMPIGRLDFNTEGLLLLTNDGGFKREMELPATGVPRTYRARTYGDISQAQLEDLMDGIEIEGVRYGPIDANMERRTGRNQWVELTLTEGKNREVRRVLEHLGLEVSRLIRTAYGPFALGDLGKGQAVEVRKEELERFRSALKGSTRGRESDGRPPKPPAPRPAREPASDGKAARPARRPSRASSSSGAKPGRPEAAGGPKGRGKPSSPPRRGSKGPKK
jgi:23S rRNA pseudouridine2605 synthase